MKRHNFLAVVFVIGLSLGLIPARIQAASAYVTFSSFAGRPSTTIAVSGGNFEPNEPVTVSFHDQPPLAQATANSRGNFGPVNITIPMTSPQGPLPIEAAGLSSGSIAGNSFYVQPFNPSIRVSSPANTPGTVVVVSGTGFAPGETVAATLDPAGNLAKADARGNFATSFTLPLKTPDTYMIHAVGQESKASAVAHFYLGGFFPSAIPSNYFLKPGQTLTFTGWNFSPQERVSVRDSDGGLLGEIAANRQGAFTNQLPIVLSPASQGLKRSYILQGEVSRKPIAFDVEVGTLSPQIFPSAYFMPPGKDIFFSGFGFAPAELVAVFEGENTQPINRIRTDSAGSFKNAYGFFMPFDFSDTVRQVRLAGEQSGAASSIEVSIGSYRPQLAPSAYFILPGQKLKIDGWNFSPGETVTVTAAEQSFRQVANRTGNILIQEFIVPFDRDSISLHAVGESTGASASTLLSVGKYNPVVAAGNYYLLPGQSLTFRGSGFAPNESVLVALNDATGQTVNEGALKADSKGQFSSKPWTIPFKSSESLSFTFTGGSSRALASVSLSVGSFSPYLNANRYSVLPGSEVKVRGAGLGSSEPVSVELNGLEVARTATNTKGETPEVAVSIPTITPSGSATVSFSGLSSGAKAILAISVQPFNPTASPSAYFTLPGTAVIFNGAGYAPGEKISVTQDGSVVASAVADRQGLMIAPAVRIPFSAGNSIDYVITGEISKKPVSLTISLGKYQPGLQLSTYYAPAGAAIRVTGSHFAPGERINVSFGSAEIGEAAADAKGGFTLATAVPPGAPGNLNVSAKGQQSSAVANTNFTRAGQ